MFIRQKCLVITVPFIAIASPIICFFTNRILQQTVAYQFGYELLIVNALLVFFGLLAVSKKQDKTT